MVEPTERARGAGRAGVRRVRDVTLSHIGEVRERQRLAKCVLSPLVSPACLSAPIALSRPRAPRVQASGRPPATGRSRCAQTSSWWSRARRCVAALGLTVAVVVVWRTQPTFSPTPCAGCLQELRWPSGPPLLRRSDAHGPALLHQRRHAPARRVGLQPPTHRVAACCHCISGVSLGHSAARLSPPSLRPLRDLSAPFQHPNACTLCTRSAPALYPSVPALRPLCTRSAPISVLALQARARHGRATARCSCG